MAHPPIQFFFQNDQLLNIYQEILSFFCRNQGPAYLTRSRSSHTKRPRSYSRSPSKTPERRRSFSRSPTRSPIRCPGIRFCLGQDLLLILGVYLDPPLIVDSPPGMKPTSLYGSLHKSLGIRMIF